ncbi:MAG: hypothetical protein AB1595_01990 [bacterium]
MEDREICKDCKILKEMQEMELRLKKQDRVLECPYGKVKKNRKPKQKKEKKIRNSIYFKDSSVNDEEKENNPWNNGCH